MNDQQWAKKIVEHCLEDGVDHFFIAPGSRCTPLTLAVADRTETSVVQHFDERGLAFAALGFGRATGKPAVFVCTSGTAVANAFPAVIEAAMDIIPLLLFTADRPDELRGTGANQTIEQRQIFSNYPHLFLNMPVPEDVAGQGIDGFEFLTAALNKAIGAAKSGPVHVNWMFREPFTISDGVADLSCSNQGQDIDLEMLKPIGFEERCSAAPNPVISGTFHEHLRGNVLIALGTCSPEEAEEAVRFAVQLGCPLLSDVTTGLRTGSFEVPAEFDLPSPDTILHLGGRILSKSWLKWTENLRTKGTEFLQLNATGQVFNPNRIRQKQIQSAICDLHERFTTAGTAPDFLEAWQNAIEKRDEVIERFFDNASELSEPAIAHHVYQKCPITNGLFIGNSMPIRDMDWFGVTRHRRLRQVVANRGVSGIDGLLATATGYAAGTESATTIILGDLSALHDLNSLSLAKNSKWPLVILLINNQGGHIFDLLPIRDSAHFEQYFATPHSYRFAAAAEMFDIPYQQIDDLGDFKKAYAEAIQDKKTTMLELITNRDLNLSVRQQLRNEIRQCSNQH